jgi:hypothetical protein
VSPARRRAWAALVAAGLSFLAALPVAAAPAAPPAAPAATPTPADPGGGALDRLAGCVRDSREILVLVLVDESGSLRKTDPSNQRVTGTKTVLSVLAGLAGAGGRAGVRVDVALAGFSAGYTRLAPWTELTPATLPGLQAGAEKFAQRNRGIDTDYAAALLGARQELAQRSGEARRGGSRAPCKALLWFTDGRYEVEDRASGAAGLTKPYAPDLRLDAEGAGARAMAAGRKLLCDPDGLVDGLRQDRVFSVSVPLSDQIAPPDRDFLAAVVLGSAGAERCGTRPADGLGTYLPVTRLGDLPLAFGRVSNEIGGGTPSPGSGDARVCAGTPCAEGRRSFEVDPALRRFQVLASTGGPGVAVQLSGPGATGTVTVEPGRDQRAKLGAVTVRASWLASDVLALDAELPPGDGAGWAGSWSVAFLDGSGAQRGKPARAEIYLYGDLVPELVGSPEPMPGGAGEPLTVRLVTTNGTPPPPGKLIRSAVVRGTLADPAGQYRQAVTFTGPDAQGLFQGSFRAPEALTATALEATLSVDVVTRSGIALAPSTRTTAVRVATPPGYPQLVSTTLSLSASRSGEAAKGVIEVTGPRAGAGCLWVDGSDITSTPAEAEGQRVRVSPDATSPSSCLRLGRGERAELAISVVPGHYASGSVTGNLSLRLVGDGAGAAVTRTLPFSFEMYRPVNQAQRAGLLLLLVVGGCLAPLAFLYLLNLAGARFPSTHELKVATIPVTVSAGSVQRLDPLTGEAAGGFSLEPDDFRPAPGRDTGRGELMLPTMSLRPKMSLNPFTLPYGAATSPGRHLVARTASGFSSPGRKTRLRLALPGSWVFVADDGELAARAGDGDTNSSVRGDLVAFVRVGGGEQQRAAVGASVMTYLPAAARSLVGSHVAGTPRRDDGAGPGRAGDRTPKKSSPPAPPAPGRSVGPYDDPSAPVI